MKRAAFTLFEVILAIGIVVIAVSVVANIQLRSIVHVLHDHDQIEKTFLIKKELYNFFLEPPDQSKKITTKLEDPDINIITQVINIPPKSSLSPFKKYLKIVQSEGRWKYDGKTTNAVMITVVPKSEKEREKEKKQ